MRYEVRLSPRADNIVLRPSTPIRFGAPPTNQMTFDEGKLKALPPGSVIVEPQGVPHFARTREPVLLHIVGEGPASTMPVKK